jgi:HSP20 family protein
MFFANATFNRSVDRSYKRPASDAYAPSVFLSARGLERWLDGVPSHLSKGEYKGVGVESDDTSVTLSLDVPGLTKEQLTIAIEGDVVRVESKADAPRSFKAAYQLAGGIDTATSQAKLENGVLTLTLGKIVPANRETVLTIN